MSNPLVSLSMMIHVLLLVAFVTGEGEEGNSASLSRKASTSGQSLILSSAVESSSTTSQTSDLGLVACEGHELENSRKCDESGTCVTNLQGRQFCLCRPGSESSTCNTLDSIEALVKSGTFQNDPLHLSFKAESGEGVLPNLVSQDRSLQEVPSPAVKTTVAPSTTPYPTLISIVPTGSWYPTQTARPTATWYPSTTWRPSVTWYPTATRRPSSLPSSRPIASSSTNTDQTPTIKPSVSFFPTEVDHATPSAESPNEEPSPASPPAPTTPAEESSESSPKSSSSSAPSGGAVFGLVAAVIAVVALVYVVWSRRSGTNQRRHRREQLRNDLELTESRASYRDRVGTYDPNEII